MAKEDMLLGVEMGRLEIEPVKLNRNRNVENPFVNMTQQRNIMFKRPFMSKCSCNTQRRNKNFGIVKKKHNGILAEPVLKIFKKIGRNSACYGTECQNASCVTDSATLPLPPYNSNTDPLSLCTLVKNCNQLKISSSYESNPAASDSNNGSKWWKNASETRLVKESKQNSQAGSCSQQALNPPCDITIDELASYFETLVHIPKKMSSMAEMMYI